MKNFIFLIIFLTAFNVNNFAHATKACPAPVCRKAETGYSEIDREKCEDLAVWVAEGTLENIQHDRQGYPLNVDFASFVFRVEKWNKSNYPDIKTISFKVGWCDNPAIPEEKKMFGLFGPVKKYRFRFYGVNSPDVSPTEGRGGMINEHPLYYDYEIIE